MINDASLEDTGKYLFNIEVSDGGEGEALSKNVEMVLEYLREPELELKTNRSFEESSQGRVTIFSDFLTTVLV